jgi:hypothetical protein
MATVQTSQSQSYGVGFSTGPARAIMALTATVACATTNIDNANDDFGLFWAPKGFVVTGIAFNATDMDDGTALVWDVGDAAVEDRLLAGITTGQAAGTSVALAATGFLYKYTARTLVKAFIKTASGTPVAGTIKVILFGFVDEEYSTTALVLA